MAKNSTAFVQTFEKGLQIMEFLVEQKVVSVTNVAKHMGIQKSASYRFLNTLKLHGFVEQNQHNSYCLTDKLNKMGNGIVPKMEFRNIVTQFLDELSKKNTKDGICNLGKWNGKEIVYMVQSANFQYSQYTEGSTVPAYCSALGKAILAYLPEPALHNYIQKTNMIVFTEKTTTAEQLLEELEFVRKNGYAKMDGELCLPLKGIAIPLVNGDEPVKYAVSATQTIYGPIDSLVAQMLKPLQDAVEDILEYMRFYPFEN